MINCFGPVYGNLGYNVHSRMLYLALSRYVDVCVIPSYPNIHHYPVIQNLQDLIDKQKDIQFRDPSICIQYGNEMHKFVGGYRIGLPMFEFTKLPVDWLHQLKQLDEVWTTTQWSREILIENGIGSEKIAKIPCGVDASFYQPQTREKQSVFTFLSIGKWEKRKGQKELLKVWAENFGHLSNVRLIIHWPNPFQKDFSLEREIASLGFRSIKNIHAVEGMPTDHQMKELYQMGDCFVLPTKGEGWGLPIMEAMAMELPVITTNYSGMTEYLDDEIAYLLDVKKLEDVYDPPHFEGRDFGKWAEVDLQQLREKIQFVIENQEKARVVGKKARERILERWTWDHAALKALDRFQKLGLVSQNEIKTNEVLT